MKYNPLQCYIELTQQCNLRCAHCFAEGSPDDSKYLSIDDIKHIYKQIAQLGIIYVNISGGEPLLHKNLFEILAFVSKQPYDTCLLTNGTLWTDETIEKLKIADPKRKITIQISMDGNFETMLKQRNITKTQYDNILNTMKKLKIAGFKVTSLLVVDTITSNSILNSAYDLLKFGYVDSAQFVPLFITGRAIENIKFLDNFWKNWFNIVKEVTIIKKENTWGEFSSHINIGFFNFYEIIIPLVKADMEQDIYDVWGLNIKSVNEYRKQIRRPFYCEAGKSELVISCNKEIFPCVASIRTNLVCGNMNNTSIETIWNDSKKLEYFRNIENFTNLAEPCNSCIYKDYCGGGCKLTSLALFNDLAHIDYRCPIVVEYRLKNE